MIVYLRMILPTDAADIVRWRSRPEISKWFFSQIPVTMENHMNWYNRYRSDPTDIRFMIVADQTPVGCVGCSHMAGGKGELGIFIGEPGYEGKGIAKLAIEMLCKKLPAFGVHTFIARVKADNARAIRLYERCGFEMDQPEVPEILVMVKEIGDADHS